MFILRYGERRRIVPLALALLVILAPGRLLADSLAGRVLDPDGKALAGVGMRLFDRASGMFRVSTSSKDGAYSFPGISAGDYTLEGEASDSGLSGSESVSVQGAKTLDLTLKVAAQTTAAPSTPQSLPRPIEGIAKTIDVVTAGEITSRDHPSIVDAVRYLPGIHVKQVGGPGGIASIRIRGLRDQDTAILIDGMRFRDAASENGDATSFLHDMAMINADRTEFLRGGASSLYGSHAIGGALNIISSPGGGAPHGEIRSEGGQLGYVRDVVDIGGGLWRDVLVYTGGISYTNVTQGVRDGQTYRDTGTQSSLRINFSPTVSLTTRLWTSRSNLVLSSDPTFSSTMAVGFPADQLIPAVALPSDQLELFEKYEAYTEGGATFIPEQIDTDARLLARFVNSSTVFEQRISRKTSYRIAYQGVSTKRALLNGPAGGPGAFSSTVARDNNNGFIGTKEFRLDHTFGTRHAASFGLESERETYRNFDGLDFANGTSTYSTEIRQHSKTIYAQDQIRFADGRAQITVIGRLQAFSLDDPAFAGAAGPPVGPPVGDEPLVDPTITGSAGPYAGSDGLDAPNAHTGDVSASYFFTGSRTKIRGHAGNSFRAPSAYQRFGRNGSSFVGDPRLMPDRAVTLDGGIDKWFAGSKVQLSATYFYTGLLQTVDFGPLAAGDPYGRTSGYFNGIGGTARGAEVSALIAGRLTSVRASYTFTNSDMRNPTIPGMDYYRALSQPDHRVAVSAEQRLGARAKVAFDMTAITDYAMSLTSFEAGRPTRGFQFDGFVKADVIGTFQLPAHDGRNIELYAKVHNVLNRTYFEDGFSVPGIWGIGGIRVRY